MRCLLALCTVIGAVAANDARLLLIYDMTYEHDKHPYHFRTCKDPFVIDDKPVPSRKHLDRLKASGSAEFTKDTLPKIVKKIGADKIIVVDLRQESHGFVNGKPVSWWADENAGNAGKDLAQIDRDEKDRLEALLKAGKVTIFDVKKDKAQKTIEKKTPVEVRVHDVQTEAQMCEAHKLGYFRVPVLDDHRPTDAEVDRFVKFARGNETWLHFHCEDGHGRTTTFLVLYDMMRNAKEVSMEDIVRRQWFLGGVDALGLPPKDSWKYEFSVERVEFVKAFYGYCKSDQTGFKKSWSEWLKEQKAKSK